MKKKPDKTQQNTEKKRKYLKITDIKEKAVILRATGNRYSDIAKILNKSEYTIQEWFTESDVKEALEQENLAIINEQRDSYGQIINAAFAAVREAVSEDANLAFQFLKESGHIPKSASQEKKEALIKELVKRMENTLNET